MVTSNPIHHWMLVYKTHFYGWSNCWCNGPKTAAFFKSLWLLLNGHFLCVFLRISPLWRASPRSTSRRARCASSCPPRRPCSPGPTAPRSGRSTLTPGSVGRTLWWAGPPRESSWRCWVDVCGCCVRIALALWGRGLSDRRLCFTHESVFCCCRADPLSNMVLSFSSKEDAIAFAEKNGI